VTQVTDRPVPSKPRHEALSGLWRADEVSRAPSPICLSCPFS
jgi:hypothetical protein